jgi:hypothetical protein
MRLFLMQRQYARFLMKKQIRQAVIKKGLREKTETILRRMFETTPNQASDTRQKRRYKCQLIEALKK